jgi:ribosomal protein L7Ae-like RNA K-turn-binding protein
MNNDKLLSLLGLATRARKIISGENVVLPQISHYPGSVIFLASDAGNNLKKKVSDKAQSFNCFIIDRYSSTVLSQAMGKQHRKLALCIDNGFNRLLLREADHT